MPPFGRKNRDEKEQAGTASMDMTPMVTMLAAAPEEQRRQMLTDRLAVFASQDEATRTRGMEAMLRAALALPDDDYARIASTRLAVMLGMAPEERTTLMQTHAAVVKGLDPAVGEKESQVMKGVVSQLPDQQREMVTGMMQKLGMTP